MEENELFCPSAEVEFRHMPRTTEQKRQAAYEEMEREVARWHRCLKSRENISN